MEEILINQLELAANLAEERLLQEYANKYEGLNSDQIFSIVYTHTEKEIYYTPEAQDRFNQLYDKFSAMIEETTI